MDKHKKLAEVLNRDDVMSRVVRDAAFFDFYVMIIIGMYFCPRERALEFITTVGDRLSFNDKITILKNIKYEKQYKSITCIETIRRVQKLRNILAHEHFVSHRNKAFKDPGIIKWLQDYPVSYGQDTQRAKDQLRRLGNTKEFLKYHDDNA